MTSKLEDFSPHTIALLRVIYLAPGLNQRAYGYKLELRPLADAGFINGSSSMVNLTPPGLDFLEKHGLNRFGYQESCHSNQYPMQVAANKALTEAMAAFTGKYKS